MPTVFLHCGAPKTGTSYLQVLFARHAQDLQAEGIHYPLNAFTEGASDGRITSGNGILMANYLRPNLPHRIDDKDAFIDEFDRMLGESNGLDFLFSSEFLIFPDNERTRRLVEGIKRNGYEVRALYLVRDLANAARSAYSQQVKRHGETRSFETFLKDWDPLYLHHTNLIANAFGEDALSVFNYDQHRNNLSKLVFQDFLNCSFAPVLEERINRSLTDVELELLRVFNQFSGEGNAFASTFASDALMNLGVEGQPEYLPNRAEIEALQKNFSQSIIKLNDRVIGEPVKVSEGYRESDTKIELNDFERFTMAILSKLVRARRK